MINFWFSDTSFRQNDKCCGTSREESGQKQGAGRYHPQVRGKGHQGPFFHPQGEVDYFLNIVLNMIS